MRSPAPVVRLRRLLRLLAAVFLAAALLYGLGPFRARSRWWGAS